MQRSILLTCVAMLAFAGNSLLCRAALRDGAIDPASFTAVRLAAGAVFLLAIVIWRGERQALRQHGSWASALILFAYAICFSLAYIWLTAGAGALLLFASVQGTMITLGHFAGERHAGLEWLGWIFAFAGMVWLLLPGIDAPPTLGAFLMILAGVAWGFYSWRGKSESRPLASTAANFLLSLVFVLPLTAATVMRASASAEGVALAILSGALTSGLGYVVWYAALEHLSSLRAAMVQLSVPAIATLGGVALLAEPLTLRLLVSSALVLGGISLALATRRT